MELQILKKAPYQLHVKINQVSKCMGQDRIGKKKKKKVSVKLGLTVLSLKMLGMVYTIPLNHKDSFELDLSPTPCFGDIQNPMAPWKKGLYSLIKTCCIRTCTNQNVLALCYKDSLLLNTL